MKLLPNLAGSALIIATDRLQPDEGSVRTSSE